MFDRTQQAVTKNVEDLVLGSHKVTVGGTDPGCFHTADITIEHQLKNREGGYPLKVLSPSLMRFGAKATLELEELGGFAATLIQTILTQVNSNTAPTTQDVIFELFRPRGSNYSLTLTGAALLQQFEINFAEDFNKARFAFEQLFSDSDTGLNSKVIGADVGGGATYGVSSPLKDAGDFSVGMPRVEIGGVSVGSVQAARVNLVTEYKRQEGGQPLRLIKLVPHRHVANISVVAEEFAPEFAGGLTLSGPHEVTLIVSLYGGNKLELSMPTAYRVPSSPQFNQRDWGGMELEFVSTGANVLTTSIT